MPVAAGPVSPEPEVAKEPAAASELAAPSCVQCGATLAPGKRFCRQCGCAVGESAQIVNPVTPTAIAAEPALPICVQCGTVLAPGKRFCRSCGHAVDSAISIEPAVADPIVQRDSSAGKAVAFDLPPAVPIAVPDGMPAPVQGSFASAENPDLAHPAQPEAANEWASPWESAHAESPALPVPESSHPLHDSPEDQYVPSGSKSGVMIAIAAVVVILAAAASVWAWHVYSHRNTSLAAKTPNMLQQGVATPPTPNQNQAAIPVPQQPAKPSPGTPENSASLLPQSSPKSATAASLPPEPKVALQNSTQPQNTATTQPATMPPQPSAPVAPPEAQRSGTLHYQGPPVPHYGTVVFDHLPKARLKFTFDHQAWSLTIKPNPDGTKKITLISQNPGYQSTCDLGWEIIE